MAEIPHVSTIGPGTELDGFVIEGVAGRGGMGVVYRARQRRPERIVALKVIAAGLADDPKFGARFKRESAIAAQIEHPNVIPVHAVGEAGGVVYIAMRFVDGTDLRRLLAQHGRLEPHRAAMVIDQVGQALDAAHACGLVHRDVKPANILISTIGGRDHVYLSDFGISRHIEGSQGLTGTGAFVGTIDYVSPEQARGGRVDARTDVYSLGCVLFESLSGTVPFPFDNDLAKLYAHDSQPPPSILERAPEISPSFEPVLQRAMAKAPDDRYLSAGDLGRAAVAAAYGESLPHGERSVAVGDAAPTGAGVATRPLPPEATVARTELGGHTLAAPTGAADTGATVRTKASIRRRRMLAGAFVIALAAALGIVFAVTRTGGHVAKAHGNANKGRGRAMTLHVPSQYPTIQEAVDKAPAGATIEIAAGTFTQQVTINKPLTLTGAGIGSTTIKAPTSYNPQLGDIRAIVTIRAGARVTISKLKVAGPSKQSCTSPSSVNDGILVGERATLELRSAAVTDIRDTPVDCAHATARAIVIGLAPQQAQGRTVTVGHATISGDLISGYGDEGIDVAGSGSTATITSNTISGRGSARYQFVAGIVVQHGAIATIAHNTITANHCISPALAAAVRSGKACGTNPLVQSHNDGILVRQVGTTTTRIEGNKLSGNDVGISLWGATDCCNVSDNALTNNYYFGYLIKDETVTLSGGSVSGGGIGVAVVAQKSSSMATLSGVHIMTSGPMTQTYPPGSPRATVVQP